MDIVFLIAGAFLGVLIGYFISKSRQSALESKLEEKEKALIDKDRIISESARETETERAKVIELGNELSASKANYKNLEDKLSDQKAELEDLQSKFTKEFENLANRILDDKSRKFTEQNKENLGNILEPLKEKIREFEQKIDNTYKIESNERISLKTEITNLIDLNKQVSLEANNLASALKGDSKMQGDWGEDRLELILQKSGLEKNIHYIVQESFKDEDGKIKRPDFIINLPDNKNLIIDSKVSLKAYTDYYNSESDDQKEFYLKEHMKSIYDHLKDLSSKNYQKLYSINTPEYVLMYVPIEPAFNLSVTTDRDLFLNALENKNIVLVTNSTILATLSTVSFIWKQESQKKNALEIARQGGALYEQFIRFLDDLEDIGNHLKKSKEAYESSMNRLTGERGSLLSKVQNLKKLGVKTSKTIEEKWLLKTHEDDLGNENNNLNS